MVSRSYHHSDALKLSIKIMCLWLFFLIFTLCFCRSLFCLFIRVIKLGLMYFSIKILIFFSIFFILFKSMFCGVFFLYFVFFFFSMNSLFLMIFFVRNLKLIRTLTLIPETPKSTACYSLLIIHQHSKSKRWRMFWSSND